MNLLDALRTTGAIRDFRPDAVPDDVLFRVLDTARFAPSGGNRQGWRVVVLRDGTVRRAVRDLYLDGWYDYLAMRQHGLTPWAPVTDEAAEQAAVADAPAIRDAAARGPGGFAEMHRMPKVVGTRKLARDAEAARRLWDVSEQATGVRYP